MNCKNITQLEFFLLKLGIVIGAGGVVYGYSIGIISGAMLQLVATFDIDSVEEGLIVSIFSVGSFFGCVLGGFLSDRIGRWSTIQSQNLLYIVGCLILTGALNVPTLYAGRFIVGMGTAFAATADVPYLQEVAPSEYRGRLTTMFEISVVFGALLGSIAAVSFSAISEGWRVMFALPCAIAIAQTVFLFWLPDSPKWLVEKNRKEEAKDALLFIHCGDEEKATAALKDFEDLAACVSVFDFYRTVIRYTLPLVLVLILMALGQMTGSVVLRNYAPTIFAAAGFSENKALLLNVMASLINFLVVCIASSYVDKVGRLNLLCVGLLVTGFGFLLLALGFIASEEGNIAIFFIGAVFSLAGFNMGFGPVGWLLSSEMFPTSIRGRMLSVSTMMRNLFEFLTNLLFLVSNASIHVYGTFFIFVSFSLLTMLFTYVFLVETKGLEPDAILEKLEDKFPIPGFLCCQRLSSGNTDSDPTEVKVVKNVLAVDADAKAVPCSPAVGEELAQQENAAL